ncbi:DUF309 domain-containing protein [Thermoactinomyces mirandus]|uniref:DUF309 domain-containing protein n=1 Tax=Thermoactinomyces mirandus TaxID=2756294 RepID=A0A7W1XS37_9BACL|nr:DUF309 domain-containing protein [Thermoactinomyces mirandus]MBA4602268.1 DUF309 domain-containing protein [Thermoactinomyces mirandus]
MEPYSPLYVSFFYLFNVEQDYYKCHDVLEELWLEEGREAYYQGLLQVAVGLYHLQNGNRNGAVKLLTSALVKLEPYPADKWMGLDLARLKQDVQQYLIRLKQEPDLTESLSPIVMKLTDPKLQAKVEELENG